VDALRRSPAFDTAPSRKLAPGDLLHIFDIDPNVLSKDAWRPRNHNCYRLGALGHGAGASPFRAAADLANAGCEPALMLAAPARRAGHQSCCVFGDGTAPFEGGEEMPMRIPSTMVRASAWASTCFGEIGMTRKRGSTGMGTVKAGPIGIRTIYEHASSVETDRT
jgi:hypothetical protein